MLARTRLNVTLLFQRNTVPDKIWEVIILRRPLEKRSCDRRLIRACNLPTYFFFVIFRLALFQILRMK